MEFLAGLILGLILASGSRGSGVPQGGYRPRGYQSSTRRASDLRPPPKAPGGRGAGS